MNNNRGFTLIELLAVVVILGVIMVLAVPNTVGMIDRNKKGNFLEDAKIFVSLAQTKAQVDRALEMPENNKEALVITLEYLNTNEISDPTYGKEYDRKRSFVLITVQGDSYKYYVHLVAKDEDSYMGINFVDSIYLSGDTKYDLVNEHDVEESKLCYLTSGDSFNEEDYNNKYLDGIDLSNIDIWYLNDDYFPDVCPV